MRRIPTIAFLLACVAGAAQAQYYHACLEYNSKYYDLSSDAFVTTLDRYNGATLVSRQQYAAFHLPAPGTIVWDEGVAFAATMQTRSSWLNNEPTLAATWIHNGANDAFMWYTTVNGVPNQFEFTTAKCRPATTAAPPAPNCMSAQNAYGVFCNANEDCCGYGSMSPQCIPKNSGKSCCTHYLAATTCNSSQTCCGSLGTGASSYAFCCNAGSSCCRAMSSNQLATCCPNGKTCCQGASIGLCCAAGEVCEPNFNRCSQASTQAPTPAPGGAHRGCTSNNGWFYDLRSDAAGTTLGRYQGTTFVDRQTYAAFHLPAAGTVVWDEGVAFAATMQTRNAWLNTEQTSAATWLYDPATGFDRWTWSTTVNGAPKQYIFVTQACP